ncbi:MAG: acetyl-CoA carboxylase biotin carboxyl carrier protein [Bernardetiaceae bacterium]|nr:acetyl-CoA carboxylase biotin carboxyl carrier protein [Bernardetiaceae bacterium]
MKVKEIQDLITFISDLGLAEVHIKTDKIEVSVKRDNEVRQIAAPAPTQNLPQVVAPTPQAKPQQVESKDEQGETPPKSNANYLPVKSPMIGTFYRAASPEAPAFVQVGDKVEKGQTICIIEAMKLFNEIETEVSGTVVQVMVENASPVEYDQVLFLVDPA